jgi:hypothetical protein
MHRSLKFGVAQDDSQRNRVDRVLRNQAPWDFQIISKHRGLGALPTRHQDDEHDRPRTTSLALRIDVFGKALIKKVIVQDALLESL